MAAATTAVADSYICLPFHSFVCQLQYFPFLSVPFVAIQLTSFMIYFYTHLLFVYISFSSLLLLAYIQLLLLLFRFCFFFSSFFTALCPVLVLTPRCICEPTHYTHINISTKIYTSRNVNQYGRLKLHTHFTHIECVLSLIII